MGGSSRHGQLYRTLAPSLKFVEFTYFVDQPLAFSLEQEAVATYV